MSDLKNWMANRWKAGLAFWYGIICVADFVAFPAWIGLNRIDMLVLLDAIKDLDVDLQREIIATAFRPHIPYTLQNSGLIHIAFGALLTGAAVTKETKPYDE